MTDKALFNWHDRNTFSPNEGMTRGMFVTVLSQRHERRHLRITQPPHKSQFADVEQ